MGLFTKDIKSMENLFLHTLQDIYYAENQIVKVLPKMIDKSTNRELARISYESSPKLVGMRRTTIRLPA